MRRLACCFLLVLAAAGFLLAVLPAGGRQGSRAGNQAASDAWEVVIDVPAQTQALPMRVALPAGFDATRAAVWQLRSGAIEVPAQVCDSSARELCFLLPAAATAKAARLTFRLQPSRTPPGGAQLRFEEAEQKYLHLLEGDSPVLTYNFGMMLAPGVPEDRRRSSYVHPLYAPGGAVLTDDFPRDHLHHRGLSWMWPNVDIAGQHSSMWDVRGIQQRFERWTERSSGPVVASFGVENGWYTGEKKVAREQVEFRVYRASGTARALDVTLTFEPLDQPIAITGELPSKKGYGGLCLRFAPRQETVIVTSGGTQARDSDLVPFPWADLTGKFGSSGRTSGAAIFVDDRNIGFPNGWTLRSYGFLGVAWPGMQPYTLQPGRPLVLRYRLWLHAGDAAGAAVAEQYAAWSKPPAVGIEGLRD